MPDKIISEIPYQDNLQTLGRDTLFSFGGNYGLVKMMFLEFIVTGTGQTYPTPTSPYLIKDCSLRSYGNSISHVTTSYTLGRIDETQSDIYNQIVTGATCTGATLTGASQIITLPLYMYVIDKQLLDTRRYKNLSLRVTTKDSYADMGFNGAITINSIKLKVIYKDPSLYVETPLKHSYNVYREVKTITSTAITPNENVERVIINNPYKISNLIFMIRKSNNSSIKGNIKSIKLTFPNNEVGIYDSKSNYSLNSTDNANFGNTFSIQIADRYIMSEDYVFPTGQNAPMYAEITYLVGDVADYKLYVACEYYSDIKEGSDGILIEETPNSIIRF